MNASTSQSFSPLPGMAERVAAYLRQHLWGERERSTEKTLAMKPVRVAVDVVFVARHIQAISSTGRQAAGLFGKTNDSVGVVRVSAAAKSGRSPAILDNLARPRFAQMAAKSSNRIVIIR